MESERWHRVKALLSEALEQTPEHRSAFLEQACDGDEALRDEVASLLAAHAAAEDEEALDAALADTEAGLLRAAPAERWSGRMVGPYRLLEEIGQGGMGAVYLGERADGEYEQQVAVKLVRRGLSTDEMLQRFRYERQILAQLYHPHIARLLDGGTTDDGVPYLVMEYVEGRPIDEYCDAHRLSTNDRLALFQTVCAAVHYAHQNLIIHRDLKPSNILVTDEGTVKLLDFGIAKLATDDDDALIPVTRTGVRVMTPEYASPEQARGEPVTTASDVYSLGVVLYQLLTGHRPYRLVGLSPGEVERVISEEEPTRPSTAVRRVARLGEGLAETREITPDAVSLVRSTQPERLQRRLEGDLDNIVLMALRKEPTRRYASAEQLGEDLRRHLEKLPVIARPDTLGYRTSKFIRRHKLGVAATLLILTALVIGLAATIWQAHVAQEERDRAQREADKAEQINMFLQEMLSSADPEREGRDVRVVEVLAQASRRVEEELVEQPEVAADIHQVIGSTYLSLGLFDEAEEHLRSALTTRNALWDGRHVDVAQSMEDLGYALRVQGDVDAAEPLLREALALNRELLGEQDKRVATSLGNLAVLLHFKEAYDEAETLYRQALELDRALLGEEHPDVAIDMQNLATLLADKGNLAEAETLFREALELDRKVLGDEHPSIPLRMTNLATVLYDKGAFQEAEYLLRDALDLRQRLLGDKHPDIGLTQMHLGRVLHATQQHEEAEGLFRQTLALWQEVLPGDHPYISRVSYSLGELLIDRGRADEAETVLRAGLAVAVASLPEDHWLTALTQNALGGALMALHRYADAEPFLTTSYTPLLDVYGPSSPRTQKAVQRLIDLYTATGRPDRAASYQALLEAPTPDEG